MGFDELGMGWDGQPALTDTQGDGDSGRRGKEREVAGVREERGERGDGGKGEEREVAGDGEERERRWQERRERPPVWERS